MSAYPDGGCRCFAELCHLHILAGSQAAGTWDLDMGSLLVEVISCTHALCPHVGDPVLATQLIPVLPSHSHVMSWPPLPTGVEKAWLQLGQLCRLAEPTATV